MLLLCLLVFIFTKTSLKHVICPLILQIEIIGIVAIFSGFLGVSNLYNFSRPKT